MALIIMFTVTLFITLLVICCKFSATLQYYIKYIIFGLCFTIFVTLPIPIMLLKPGSSKNGNFVSLPILWATRLLGLTVTLEGLEHVVRDSGCVIVLNHQSMIDAYVMVKLWANINNCTIISKKQILYFQPFALGALLCGVIFIDKRNGRNQLNKTRELIEKQKKRIIIFPEGTRNFTDKLLLPFKKGAFHLAISSKCPIQPVVVSRYDGFLGHRRFYSGNIRIKILPSISTENYNIQNLDGLVEKTHRIMYENLDLLTKTEDATLN